MSYLVNSFRYMSIYFLPFAKCKKKKKNATFYNISMHLMLLNKDSRCITITAHINNHAVIKIMKLLSLLIVRALRMV